MRALYGAALLHLTIVELPGDYRHGHPGSGGQSRDFLGAVVAVVGIAELVFGRQVEPQLEAAHHAFLLLGHLAVNDAARSGHPLHAATLQQAGIAQVVFVAHAPFEHVGDGLEAAMRVRREAGDVVVGVVRAELVEHQEGVETLDTDAAEYAGQAYAGTVCGGLADMLGNNVAELGHGAPPK
jgi:hypothetical protein